MGQQVSGKVPGPAGRDVARVLAGTVPATANSSRRADGQAPVTRRRREGWMSRQMVPIGAASTSAANMLRQPPSASVDVRSGRCRSCRGMLCTC